MSGWYGNSTCTAYCTTGTVPGTVPVGSYRRSAKRNLRKQKPANQRTATEKMSRFIQDLFRGLVAHGMAVYCEPPESEVGARRSAHFYTCVLSFPDTELEDRRSHYFLFVRSFGGGQEFEKIQ
jgi:hypothetical protein